MREEEWAPGYGGTRARMDFLLKHERTVVETKMTCPGLDQRQIVDEKIVDKEALTIGCTAIRRRPAPDSFSALQSRRLSSW